MRSVRGLRMTNGQERLLQQLLQVGLPDIDDVVDIRGAAERRVIGSAVRIACGPQRSLRPRLEEELAALQDARVSMVDRSKATQAAVVAAFTSAAERLEAVAKKLNQSVGDGKVALG